MSGPSNKAVQAFHAAHSAHIPTNRVPSSLEVGLAAAHDPALGLDRSVCLRDVVEALEGHAADHMADAREHVLRKFGGAS